MDQFRSKVAPADGKLAILLPGMGAVATTFIAGVEAVKAGLGKPIGSLTQMAHIRLGKRSEKRWAMIKDLVPLTKLEDLVFGGWDPIPDDAYTAAAKAKVLSPEHLAQLQSRTESKGYTLRQRLPVYPEFVTAATTRPGLLSERVRAAADPTAL